MMVVSFLAHLVLIFSVLGFPLIAPRVNYETWKRTAAPCKQEATVGVAAQGRSYFQWVFAVVGDLEALLEQCCKVSATNTAWIQCNLLLLHAQAVVKKISWISSSIAHRVDQQGHATTGN